LPARHFSGRSLFNRFETLRASFALVGPKHRVYYGADSGEWDGFGDIGKQFGPFDLTMLEIGASDLFGPTFTWARKVLSAVFGLLAATACSCPFIGDFLTSHSTNGRSQSRVSSLSKT
jgi:hypothetical protein